MQPLHDNFPELLDTRQRDPRPLSLKAAAECDGTGRKTIKIDTQRDRKSLLTQGLLTSK